MHRLFRYRNKAKQTTYSTNDLARVVDDGHRLCERHLERDIQLPSGRCGSLKKNGGGSGVVETTSHCVGSRQMTTFSSCTSELSHETPPFSLEELKKGPEVEKRDTRSYKADLLGHETARGRIQ